MLPDRPVDRVVSEATLETIVAALADQQHELSGLLSGRPDEDWQRPSRCQGWSVADVVLHLAQTDQLALASAAGRFADAVEHLTDGMGPAASIDAGADSMVARERGQSATELFDRWRTGAGELCQALAGCDPRTRVQWVAGELSARTLATTRLAETWIHTGDVAAAFGTVPVPTDRLWHIARLAWRTLPYAFGRGWPRSLGPGRIRTAGPGWRRVDLRP